MYLNYYWEKTLGDLMKKANSKGESAAKEFVTKMIMIPEPVRR